MNTEIEKLLGESAKNLLEHQCKTVPREKLHLPGPDFVDRVYSQTDRSARVLGSLHDLGYELMKRTAEVAVERLQATRRRLWEQNKSSLLPM